MKPEQVAEKVENEYINFLSSTIAPGNKTLRNELERKFKENGVVRQPKISQSIKEYDKDKLPEGLLAKPLQKFIEKEFDQPYQHQIQAWQNILNGKDTIISTGTGSGKTECFTFPAIQKLLQENNEGSSLLIIYPMKTLANDQAQRIDRLLKHIKDETDQIFKWTIFDGDRRSRDVSKIIDDVETEHYTSPDESVPEIFLTNYVMLDRILLDNRYDELLDQLEPDIVALDEIHYYSGIQAVDLSNLIDRFKSSLNNQPVMTASSATLGESKGTRTRVKQLLNTDKIDIIKGASTKGDNKRIHTFFSAPPKLYRCSNSNCKNLDHGEREECNECQNSSFLLNTCRMCGSEFEEVSVQLTANDLRNIDRESPLSIQEYSSEDSSHLLLSKKPHDNVGGARTEQVDFCEQCNHLSIGDKEDCSHQKEQYYLHWLPDNTSDRKDGTSQIFPNATYRNDTYCPNCHTTRDKGEPVIVPAHKISDENCSHIVYGETASKLEEDERKLLIFTDSRERCSKFARELEETYYQRIARNILIENVDEDGVTALELILECMRAIELKAVELSKEETDTIRYELWNQLLNSPRNAASLRGQNLLKLECTEDVNPEAFRYLLDKKLVKKYLALAEGRDPYLKYKENTKEELIAKLSAGNIRSRDVNLSKEEAQKFRDILSTYNLADDVVVGIKPKKILVKEGEASHSDSYYASTTDRSPEPIQTVISSGALDSNVRETNEQKFKRGHKDTMVSTPTLELGVDIGDLQTVGILYAPPKQASYIQRVGRAGRKEDQDSLVISYLSRRVTDAHAFREPDKLVKGEPELKPLRKEDLAMPRFRHRFAKWYQRHGHEVFKDLDKEAWQNWEELDIELPSRLEDTFCELLERYMAVKSEYLPGSKSNVKPIKLFQEAGILPTYGFPVVELSVGIGEKNFLDEGEFNLQETLPPSTFDYNKRKYESRSFHTSTVISHDVRQCNDCKTLHVEVETCPTCAQTLTSRTYYQPTVIFADQTKQRQPAKWDWDAKPLNMSVREKDRWAENGQILIYPKHLTTGELDTKFCLNCGEKVSDGSCDCSHGSDWKPAQRIGRIIPSRSCFLKLDKPPRNETERLTLKNGVLSACIQVASCEENELGASVIETNDEQYLWLYDDVYGGVGFCDILNDEYHSVKKKAEEMSESQCCDTGCNRCIGSFWRQDEIENLRKRDLPNLIEELLP